MLGLFIGGEVLERDQHSSRLSPVTGYDDGLMVFCDAIERGGEIFAEIAVGGCAHGSNMY